MRYPEIDLLRGIAIVLMVIFHLLFDIEFLGIREIEMSSGAIYALGNASAILFLVTAGISLHLSFLSNKPFKAQLKRGMIIIASGMLVSLATYISYPEGTVIFGILHLIGLSAIVLYPVSYRPYIILFILPIALYLGKLFQGILIYTPWFLPFGIRYYGFKSFDYYPIFPWIAFILAGIFLGYHLYGKTGRTFPLPKASDEMFPKSLQYIGRHSLLIYLIHQPVLIGILLIVT